MGGTIGNRIGGEVQIWRRNIGSENDYTKVGYSILDATDPDNDNVYEHIPDPPLEFQEGDILGVYYTKVGYSILDATDPDNDTNESGNTKVLCIASSQCLSIRL